SSSRLLPEHGYLLINAAWSLRILDAPLLVALGPGLISPTKQRRNHHPGDGNHGQHDQTAHRHGELPLMLHYDRPEILNDDAQAIQRVIQYAEEDEELADTEERVAI